MTYVDPAPTNESFERVYHYLAMTRRVDVFVSAMPGASIQALVGGPRMFGQQPSTHIVIFDELMNSTSGPPRPRTLPVGFDSPVDCVQRKGL